MLSKEERQQALQDCAVIIQDCQQEISDLKSRRNPFLLAELIKEAEERLMFFLQLKRRLRDDQKAAA
ncbi:MAG: hypothetical protein ACOCQT_00215 [Desulfovermiculus sp.]